MSWHTFPKFAQELVDFGTKFEKQKNTEGLKTLKEYDEFVKEMEKKYENA